MFWLFIITLVIILILIKFLNWFLPDGTLAKSFRHLFIISKDNQQEHEKKISTELNPSINPL